MGGYLRPGAVQDALEALDRRGLTIVSGGTDFYPARVGQPLDDDILDISGLAELRGITETDSHHVIGAITTWTDVIRASLPPYFDGLKLAAREVGGLQIQNAGTVCGNICNASPAADGVPPLLALDARVELSSRNGVRSLPLTEFIIGNRKTARRPDELVTGLTIPKPANPAMSGFLKLGARRYLVISIVMVAGVLERAPDGTVAAARLAVGSCSEVARRMLGLERVLAGRPIGPELGSAAMEEHVELLAPIDDVRGTAEYRQEAALTLVRRLLRALGSAP
ncbi:MAG: xanthine dehydrogenase family protein subunit M [Alphaproteobacteria bacterium]|nr:xanthine dehydrogenase family protein subunit M [Alphaproteobacteria bacterium]